MKSAMLKAAAKRYARRSACAALRCLPLSIQLRLCRELVGLLGNQTAKVAPSVMACMAVSDRASLMEEVAANLPNRLDICSRVLMAVPPADRALFLHELIVQADAKEGDFFNPLLAPLPREKRVSIFQQVAARLEVSLAEVSGANGRLAGYLADEGIFLPYLRDRTWFWNGVELINSVFVGRSAGTFIDIGANIGAVVVPVARANPRVNCYAFEPEHENFFALGQNIARNHLENVQAYQIALADADGPVTFELSDSNFGDHRLRKPGAAGAPVFDEEHRATIKVDARRLDRVLSVGELARPIVAKIDVQGAEPMVLAGGETILDQTEVLIIEYWPYGMRRLGADPIQFLSALSEIFPFAARVVDQAVVASDFVPFATMRAELDAFAEERTWMHLNLALTRHPLTELAR